MKSLADTLNQNPQRSAWVRARAMWFLAALALTVASPLPLRAAPAVAIAPTNTVAAIAPSGTGDQDAYLQADSLTYDKESDTIIAEGNVEVVNESRILRADLIIWDRTDDVIRAHGRVVTVQPSGDAVFSETAEVTGDMRNGFVNRVSVLFPDNARLIANDARRYDGRWLVADKGIYSACNLCAEDPRKAPLWQVKGARITHDNVAQDVIYRDATVEFGGIPVFYSPYLSHPAPGVTRRQGFLMASGGYNKNIGSFVRTPYYFDIAPNTDFLLTPTFSTTDRLQASGSLRHRFENGEMNVTSSLTRAELIDEYGVNKGKNWRGHIVGDSVFDVSNVWRVGTDVALTTDKSYMRRYDLSYEDFLINRAYAEGFHGRNYVVANTYYFQDLRPGISPVEPLVMPEVIVSALGEPGRTWGGRWSADASLLITSRHHTDDPARRGPDTRRLSLEAGWQRQLISDTGLVTEAGAFARLDGYNASNFTADNSSAIGKDMSRMRPFSQADLTLRYPFSRRGDSYQHLLEPIVMLSAAPDISYNNSLPNEDSTEVNFDETNLFSSNRFTGVDRVESGTRIAYGMRNSMVGDNGARIEALVGRVFRFKENEDFTEASGLQRENSDLVGRIEFAPRPWVDLRYGWRFDTEEMEWRRHELRGSAGVREFRPSINFISVRRAPTSGVIDDVKEATFGLSSSPVRYWTGYAYHKQAFAPDAGARLTTLGIVYDDECFRFDITGSRDHTVRQDVASGDSVMVHLYLKTIGGF